MSFAVIGDEWVLLNVMGESMKKLFLIALVLLSVSLSAFLIKYLKMTDDLSEDYYILDNDINVHQTTMVNYVIEHKEDILRFCKDLNDEFPADSESVLLRPTNDSDVNLFIISKLNEYDLDYFTEYNNDKRPSIKKEGNMIVFIYDSVDYDDNGKTERALYSFVVENDMISVRPFVYTSMYNGV